jgi:hypothetical protein
MLLVELGVVKKTREMGKRRWLEREREIKKRLKEKKDNEVFIKKTRDKASEDSKKKTS